MLLYKVSTNIYSKNIDTLSKLTDLKETVYLGYIV